MTFFRARNNLYRRKAFWLATKWLEEKPVFSFWKILFRGHRNLNSTKRSFHILLPTLPVLIKTVLYSIFIITVFESFNYLFPVSWRLDEEAINALLTAIASVTGVFLGLYFTAISSIASNFLIRATQDVRHFFLSAPRGQQYVQTVALTGIVSVFYLVVKSFGHSIHPLSLAFLSVLAAYVIIRFWSVGSGVFNSLEPTDSLPWITRDIADAIRGVVPPGFQWDKPAIQNHHRRLGSYYLDLVNNLVNFGIKEIKLSSEQLVVALKYLGGLLFFYSAEKSKVPTTSFWYKTKSQYESWTLADSTVIALALNTGTPIQPKTIKDFTWLEEQSLDIAVRVFNHLATEKKIGSAFEGLEAFVDSAEAYGKDLNEQSIKLLFQKLENITAPIYTVKTDPQSIEYKEQLAFVDSQGRLAIAALLGLIKYIDQQSCKKLSEIISKIKWTNKSSIYLTGLPSAMLPRLESIANELKNEKIIEGEIISPNWYIKTLCIQQHLFSLKNYFEYLKSLHTEFFQPKLDKLLTENQLALAIQLIQRWIEFSNKYSKLVADLRKHIESCNDFKGVKDLPWPDFDFDSETKVAIDREKEVSEKLIQLLPKLKTLAVSEDLPDYFGQALTMGVEACYQACQENDPERLKRIFPVVFDASLAAFDKTREKVQNWTQEDSKIIYSTEPLINLLELSGYTKLYSELYQNPELWNVAQRLWDIYFEAVSARQVLQFIAAISNYRDSLFMIMPQAMLRANWQIWFEDKMREHGLPVFPDDRDFINRRERASHPSPLIRVLARWGGLSIVSSARNIFFATYLSNLPAAEGVKFPDRHDLKELIEKETKGENNKNEDEDE